MAVRSDEATTEELKGALSREKARSAAVARELEAAKRQLAALETRSDIANPPKQDPQPALKDDKKKARTSEPAARTKVVLPRNPVEQIKPDRPKPTSALDKEAPERDSRVSARTSPQRRPPVREVDRAPEGRLLRLPSALQPIGEFWDVY
jgi:hypothetical protein